VSTSADARNATNAPARASDRSAKRSRG